MSSETPLQMLLFLILEEVLSPCQHIPIDRPVPACRLIGIDARGSHFGITVDSKIDHREVLHAFLIAFRPLKCFLEQTLSFFPRLSHSWKYLLQLAPFTRQARIFPRYLYSTSDE